ncbi:helix-turn-helix domain-containing protein [Natronobacillus azotifigens]|uniref:Helix-turn-helix domain-containing protein n=1 Tax=Natronobacillus azotifigens TaxID=472978 RepID=A0A9J6RDH6_9BACI|nr:helix-turn-helix domain-containing protein [Natronobacillus azotifigens]
MAVTFLQILQVTRQTITAIENCKYNPGLELSLKIAKYFDLSVHDIFRLKESAEPNQ